MSVPEVVASVSVVLVSEVVLVSLPEQPLAEPVVSEMCPEAESSVSSVVPIVDSRMFLCEFSFATFSSIL